MTTLTTRLDFLRRHVAMLSAAQAHLGATARHINAGRIREARAELESVEFMVALVARDGGVYADDGAFIQELDCNCGVPYQVQCDRHGPRE